MPPRAIVHSGDVYGRLSIVREVSPSGTRRFECRCKCGVVKFVHFSALRSGRTISCGCYNQEKRTTRQGLNLLPYGRSYGCMMARCYDEKHHAFHRYGGRGIRVCCQWRDPDNGVRNFQRWNESLPISEQWRPGLQLDRKENDLGYGPENCRWTTPKQQSRNRHNTRYIRFRGRRMALSDVFDKLSEEKALPKNLTYVAVAARYANRYKHDWSLKDIFLTPMLRRSA